MTGLLVTGAGGFIGSYLCEYFANHGRPVLAGARNRLPELETSLPACTVISFDVLSDELPEPPFSLEAILHAATANDILSRNPEAGLQLSALGTRNILEYAVRHRIPKVIVFSTLQVYGTELDGLITEDTPVRPQNDYAVNHLAAEMYLRMYTETGKVRGAIVRPSNVYGRMTAPTVDRWSLVPGCFCKEVLKQQSITLKSSGKQVRNFVSLDEVARGCEQILNHFPETVDVFNLAGSGTSSILEVAHRVKALYEEHTGRSVALNILSEQPAKGNDFSISTEKLSALGESTFGTMTLDSEILALFAQLDPTFSTTLQGDAHVSR